MHDLLSKINISHVCNVCACLLKWSCKFVWLPFVDVSVRLSTAFSLVIDEGSRERNVKSTSCWCTLKNARCPVEENEDSRKKCETCKTTASPREVTLTWWRIMYVSGLRRHFVSNFLMCRVSIGFLTSLHHFLRWLPMNYLKLIVPRKYLEQGVIFKLRWTILSAVSKLFYTTWEFSVC